MENSFCYLNAIVKSIQVFSYLKLVDNVNNTQSSNLKIRTLNLNKAIIKQKCRAILHHITPFSELQKFFKFFSFISSYYLFLIPLLSDSSNFVGWYLVLKNTFGVKLYRYLFGIHHLLHSPSKVHVDFLTKRCLNVTGLSPQKETCLNCDRIR